LDDYEFTSYLEIQLFIEEEQSARCQFWKLSTWFLLLYRKGMQEIMEGSVVRGALGMCEGAQLKMAFQNIRPPLLLVLIAASSRRR